MKFDSPLLFGTLLLRHKRFFADIRLDNGELVLAHCPNSGSMKGVNVPGAPVAVSWNPDPDRRLRYTWQMIFVDGGWTGVNTLLPNRIVAESLSVRSIPAFRRFSHFQKEVKIADDTRIDFVLSSVPGDGRKGRLTPDQVESGLWLEVKNVSLCEDRLALFPDSITERGTKHLLHLTRHVKRGGKAAMLYVVQHHAAEEFSPADAIDPVYGKALRVAVGAGVKIEAWKASVSPIEINLSQKLPVRIT